MKEYMLEVTQRGHVFISGADSFEEAEELWKNSSVAGQFDIEWTNESQNSRVKEKKSIRNQLNNCHTPCCIFAAGGLYLNY